LEYDAVFTEMYATTLWRYTSLSVLLKKRNLIEYGEYLVHLKGLLLLFDSL